MISFNDNKGVTRFLPHTISVAGLYWQNDTVSAYFTSKQILPFAFVEYNSSIHPLTRVFSREERAGASSGFGSRSRRFEGNKMFLPHPRVKVSIVGSLRDREVACSASDRQGSNFELCVWRTVSSQSSDHPQEVLLAQFSLYVHKGGQ